MANEIDNPSTGTIPQLLPYVTSFATIGIIWLNHHSMFHEVEKVKHATLTLILLLLAVAFILYPTSVVGRYGALESIRMKSISQPHLQGVRFRTCGV